MYVMTHVHLIKYTRPHNIVTHRYTDAYVQIRVSLRIYMEIHAFMRFVIRVYIRVGICYVSVNMYFYTYREFSYVLRSVGREAEAKAGMSIQVYVKTCLMSCHRGNRTPLGKPIFPFLLHLFLLETKQSRKGREKKGWTSPSFKETEKERGDSRLAELR